MIVNFPIKNPWGRRAAPQDAGPSAAAADAHSADAPSAGPVWPPRPIREPAAAQALGGAEAAQRAAVAAARRAALDAAVDWIGAQLRLGLAGFDARAPYDCWELATLLGEADEAEMAREVARWPAALGSVGTAIRADVRLFGLCGLADHLQEARNAAKRAAEAAGVATPPSAAAPAAGAPSSKASSLEGPTPPAPPARRLWKTPLTTATGARAQPRMAEAAKALAAAVAAPPGGETKSKKTPEKTPLKVRAIRAEAGFHLGPRWRRNGAPTGPTLSAADAEALEAALTIGLERGAPPAALAERADDPCALLRFLAPRLWRRLKRELRTAGLA